MHTFTTACTPRKTPRFMPSKKITYLLDKEAQRVEPRQQNVLDDRLHAGLAEAQRLRAHDRRVNEVQPQRVGAVCRNDLAQSRSRRAAAARTVDFESCCIYRI
eukprot:TRINITY_DN765_c3_g1_i13.p4 TRINITY_DN765_c3_g1~~TRINITY_DN765_c3_g1_i13.p4  ORF type:complete len:103 (-),score=0.82 TRINITY_DN765_c3_g1_i13:2703-3011(-)